MALERILRFVFVLYCTTVGVVLLLIPWSPGWDQMIGHLPFSGARLLQVPLARGALSGFGLVHFVWGAYDLSEFLRLPIPHEPQKHP